MRTKGHVYRLMCSFQKFYSVVFECRDGEVIRCSRWVLELSDFFAEKIKAFDNFKNELKFDYTTYSVTTIKLFLDLIHGIYVPKFPFSDLSQVIQFLSFLSFEGKSGT